MPSRNLYCRRERGGFRKEANTTRWDRRDYNGNNLSGDNAPLRDVLEKGGEGSSATYVSPGEGFIAEDGRRSDEGRFFSALKNQSNTKSSLLSRFAAAIFSGGINTGIFFRYCGRACNTARFSLGLFRNSFIYLIAHTRANVSPPSLSFLVWCC